MTARYDDLGTAQSVFDRDHVGAEAIADVVIFNHDPFALGHDRFKFSKIENHVRAIEPAHRAAHDFAGAILELLVNHFLLDLADTLHHRLLGGLRRDASKILRGDFHFNRVADLHLRFELASPAERDLILGIRHVLDHDQVRQRPDVAGLRIDVDPQIAGGADAFLRRRKQRGGKRFEQGLALDSALPLHVIQHCCYFRVHKTSSPQTKRSGTSFPTPSSAD